MGAVSCGEQFVHCYAMQDGNSVLWRTICALLDAMQGRECCVHGHHHGSRSRGNSLRATVETSWRQFSVKLLFSLFASQLEIRPYTHLVQLVYTHHTWHSIKKLTVGIKCRQHWIFEYFTLNIISSIPLQEV
ncbi:hypothetical protein SORBI_3006G146600 [Sorghum bicolor]|uniref:Uncharacterized protein n=1 Tax=Sorghum bicolor TaxID=4558 RepID=A0A1Z5RDY8_SORBI|nr:hypothetical protein SORBI_3006G146600 [Sorghum bicolor]